MTPPRFDIYRQIHKAMRACMSDALLAAGQFDPMDDGERVGVLARVRAMLSFARLHLEKENRFVHPAMEARAPGSTQHTAGDHVEHMEAFADLDQALDALEHGPAAERPNAAHALYGKLGHFVGENLVHMQVEETVNNEVLWRTHCGREIIAIEHAIVGSLSPQEKMYTAPWMLTFANPAERLFLLRLMREAMPPQAFAGLMGMLETKLSPAHWGKLTAGLEQPGLAA